MRDAVLRPICDAGPGGRGAPLAGGPIRFGRLLSRSPGGAACETPLSAVDRDRLAALTAARAPVLGVAMDRPRIMGVINVTPDSFSDGGVNAGVKTAVAHGLEMVAAGADLLDVGGESTRPGAEPTPRDVELARVIPVIEGLVARGVGVPISIDTRNAAVARAAFAAGARLFNDVSALTHDPESLAFAAEAGATVCLMHSLGDPRTMQRAPAYDDVVGEVYAFLAERAAACVAAGIPRTRIVVDPGIGFGKTLSHNLELIGGLAAFQGLGAPVLLGASRKRFIGTISGVEPAGARAAGSIGAALAGAMQGANILRAHDVAQTAQALRVWMRASGLWSEA